MLRPEYFDSAADDIITLYNKLTESGIKDICRRIARFGKITKSSRWQVERLEEAGALYEDIIKSIAAKTGKSDQAVLKLFEEASVKSIRYDDIIYKAAGLSPLPLRQSPAMLETLEAGLTKTGGIMRNLTLTTAVTSQQAYIQACDLAYMQVSSGLMSYNTAITRAVVAASTAGLTVLYPSGHTDKLDVAIRRAVLTGVNQTCAQMQLARADDMGCDLVETTAHNGARPSHAEWQGEVFSRSGSNRKYRPFSVTGYGTGPGLCGWNCRHSFFPFFEGLSLPAQDAETVEGYKDAPAGVFAGVAYTVYEATQKQREIERRIRSKRQVLVGLNAAIEETPDIPELREEFEIQSAKLKAMESKLREFCKATGQIVDTARIQKLGFGRSVSQKAVHAAKRRAKK